MAKYTVECPDCGTSYTVQLYGPNKDRQWRLDNFDWTCDDCKQKARDEENAKAAAVNADAGLPSLTGTEKQIAWAETIRKQKIVSLKDELAHYSSPASYLRIRSEDFNQSRYEIALKNLQHKNQSLWWIDNRDTRGAILLRQEYDVTEKPLPIKEQEIAKKAEAEAKAEATIRPEKPITETVAEIHILEKFIEVSFPEKREDFRQLVRFGLGYSWDKEKSRWIKIIGMKTGSAPDRAAELGNKLLAAGFSIRIFDTDLRAKAIAGKYESECHRWIMKRIKGDYAGWFSISWPREEDFYKAAKKLPGSRYDKPDIVVPSEQFEQVLDFAEMYEFNLSPGAQEAAEAARKIKEAAMTVHIETKKEIKHPLPGDKPAHQDVPESVEVADEFKEEE